MGQCVAYVGFLTRPFVLELPFAWEQVYELGLPVECGDALRERCNVAALGKVVYEDTNGTGEEGFRARGEVKQCLQSVSM